MSEIHYFGLILMNGSLRCVVKLGFDPLRWLLMSTDYHFTLDLAMILMILEFINRTI
jgi:hypothetical protein